MSTKQVTFPVRTHSSRANESVALKPDVEDQTLRSQEIKRSAAKVMGMRAAVEYGLPQTVYRNSDSCAWAHTNTFATVLNRSEMSVMALNRNFFN